MSDLWVGEVFETATATLSLADIVAFAKQFDPQPMHLDEESAKQTIFRRQVASGWHVAAVTMRLMVEAHPFGATPLVGLAVSNLQFHKAVLPETAVRCKATIQALEPGPKPAHGHVTTSVETLDARSGELLMSQTWKVLVPTAARD